MPEDDHGGKPAYTIGGATEIAELGPEQCDLGYWLSEVAGKPADRNHEIPPYLMQDEPLRHALLAEFSFQAIAEDKATRALPALISGAPDSATLEFYSSQLVDEVKHRRLYREHLLELGVAAADLDDVITQYAGAAADLVLTPIERYGLDDMAEHDDFYRGVLIVTVLVEGVIAPITELSELKWRTLDPGAAHVQLVANRDETRHLAVGSTIIRRHLTEHPERRPQLLELVHAGRELWQSVPMGNLQLMLEQLFQQGMQQHSDVVGDYEIWPGRRMIDTTPEERTEVAQRWSQELQDERLAYMLLSDA